MGSSLIPTVFWYNAPANRGVSQLLPVGRAGIPPLAGDPQRIAAVLDADKHK
jgi:hypothetical protein